MKNDQSHSNRLPNPLPAVTFLNHPPQHSHLFEILLAAEKNPGTHYCFRWSSQSTGVVLDLYVVSPIRAPQEGWGERKSSNSDEPEWQLHSEEYGKRKQVWTLQTNDLNILTNKIAAESVPKAPEQSLAAANRAGIIPEFNKKSDSLQQVVLSRMGLMNGGQAPDAPVTANESNLQLSGSIRDLNVCDVLQSINLCRMTGKLNLLQTQKQVEMYFIDGDLVHARACLMTLTADQIVGEGAALDVFTWEDGTFQFQHGGTNGERSITRQLAAILMEGATLQDYRSYLSAQNLSQMSFLVVPNELATVSEEALDVLLKSGVPKHIALQKLVFARLKKGAELRQLVTEMNLQSTVWIPIVFNLLNLKLVSIARR